MRFTGLLPVALAALVIHQLFLPASAFARRTHTPSAGGGDSQIVGSGPSYAHRDDARALADQIAAEQVLPRAWVRSTLGKAHRMPQLAKLVLPPSPGPAGGTARNWRQYRSRMLDGGRVQGGVSFWAENEQTLARAQSVYGVPAEIIVGIIGVETRYGREMGRYRVLDTLATLALDFPAEHPRASARTAFFKGELSAFLRQCHDQNMDPLKARGSYAGAMGIPQFMPSSFMRYAVDFDGDGRIDLVNSVADAIGSVARYFQSFDWKPGMPTHYAVDFDYARLDMPALLAPDIRPTFDGERFAALGAVVAGPGRAHTGPLALIELQNGEYSPTYIAGTENFYAITRYNWSSYYAYAVIELGQAVARVRSAVQASTTPSNTGCSRSIQDSSSASPICR